MSILIDGVWAGCGNQSGGGCGEENVVRNGIQSSILNGGSSAFYMFAPVGRQTNAEVLSSHIEHSVQEMPGRGIVSWIIHDTYCLISVSRTERMSPFESLWLASISMIYIYMYAIILPMSFDHGGHSPWSYEFGQVPGGCFLTFICSQFVPKACAPSCNSMLFAMTLWKANSVLRFQATNSNNNYQHPPTWLLTFRLLLRKWIVLAILPWSGPWSTAAWWREFGVLQADYVKYVIWHSNPTKVFCGKML